MTTRWSALSQAARDTLWRSLQAFNATRVVIAVVLSLYMLLDRDSVSGPAYIYAETCLAYLALALGFAVLTNRVRRRFMTQVVVQLTVDISVISLLYLSAGAARSGLVILYLFPLAGAAILAPLTVALFSAAMVTLFLLAENLIKVFMYEGSGLLRLAGLYGAAFFALVLLLNRLASKLIGQEELAARRGAALRIQQAINQIIIADVEDGILVAGHDGTIFTGNPAARYMLGLPVDGPLFRLDERPEFEPLAQAFAAWLEQADALAGRAAQRAAFVTIKPYHGQSDGQQAAWGGRRDLAAHLKLRFAKVEPADEQAERCVIFMQDVTAIENQAQELKLASMGRLTASIAHEVRNPLAAIGHATALLAEDATDPGSARLLKIVGDNVTRVNRMVEDILQLSRKVQPGGEPLFLGPFLAELKAEYEETQGLSGDIVSLGNTGSAPVRFDALHLREVLVNLLTNAIRYASGMTGSIRIFVLEDGSGRTELHVQDDGPGITPEVRAHLFEPFYTTSSKGTGLGLYLARELCLNNEAMLDYEYRFDSGFGQHKASGRFVVTFAQALAV